MADPKTIALIVGTGTAVSAYGQYQQGRAAEAQGQTEPDILNYNVQLKIKEAEDIRAATQEEARKFGLEARRFRGTQRAAIARAGVLSTVGTPALLLEETAQELEADRLAILKQGYLEAGYTESEAVGLRLRGVSARARGKAVRRGSRLSAVGTLLTGIGSTSLAYKQLKG